MLSGPKGGHHGKAYRLAAILRSSNAVVRRHSICPGPIARTQKKAGDAAGLTQYGVNLLRLPPGAWSSQRHWHTGSDEFVYVVAGEAGARHDDGRRSCVRARAAVSRPAMQRSMLAQTIQAAVWCSKSEPA